jgi:hypothetical protein
LALVEGPSIQIAADSGGLWLAAEREKGLSFGGSPVHAEVGEGTRLEDLHTESPGNQVLVAGHPVGIVSQEEGSSTGMVAAAETEVGKAAVGEELASSEQVEGVNRSTIDSI